MNQPGAVDGCQRSGQILSDQTGLAGAERTVDADHLLERDAPDQFHPETDLPVMLAGAIDRDDIGMAHARQGAPFVQESGCDMAVVGGWPQELDGDQAIQLRIVRPIHRTERAPADFLEQDEIAPARPVKTSLVGSRAGRRARFGRVRAPPRQSSDRLPWQSAPSGCVEEGDRTGKSLTHRCSAPFDGRRPGAVSSLTRGVCAGYDGLPGGSRSKSRSAWT